MAGSLYAFLDHDEPIPFAHRASSSTMPDNSMSSIEAVVELGYRYIETDVRTTSDGVPLLLHDAQPQGTSRRIHSMTYEALASMSDRESVPRLEDVLATWPVMRLNIDLKDGYSVRAVAKVLRRASAVDRVCVTSFFDQRITAIRGLLGPALCTGLGTISASLVKIMSAAPQRLRPRRLPVGGAVLQVPIQFHGRKVVTPELVSYAHDLGLKVHVWTVNDTDLMETMLDMHVDGIITDELISLKNLLLRRSLWRP